MASLQDLIARSNANSAQAEELLGGITTAYQGAIAASSDAQGAAERIGESNAIIVGQEQRSLMEAQNQARRFATANGTNLSDQYEILSMLGLESRQAAQDLVERSRRVDTLSQKANLGNPLGLLYDVFYGDSERAALDSAQDRVSTINQSIQALNQSTQTTAQTQKAIANTITDATIASSVQLELDKATEAAAKYRIQTASLNVDMLDKINSYNTQDLNNAFKIYQAQVSEEQRAFMNEQRLAMRKAAQEAKIMDEGLLKYYNLGGAALGLAPAKTVAEFKMLEGVNKVKVDMAITKGAELAQTGHLSFGNTPQESLSMKRAFRMQVPENQQPVFDQLEVWSDEFAASPGDALVLAKMAQNSIDANNIITSARSKEAKDQLLDAYLGQRFSQEVASLSLENPSGILAMPPIDVIKGMPILDENKFLTTYVKPDVEAGGGIAFNPGKYLQMAQEAILKGELTTSEVADGLATLSQGLFMKGVGAKNLTQAFGLPGLRSYNVPVVTKSNEALLTGDLSSTGGITYQHSGRIDILDKAAWNKYIADYTRKSVSNSVLQRLQLF